MNPRLIMLGLGLAIGYVLGTREGRERYEWMKGKVTGVWEDPRVAKARQDLEAYARQQAPIIRERAEAAAKAAPGVIADTAKEVAERTADLAKDVAAKSTDLAKDVAAKSADLAKDVAAKSADLAKDVAGKVTATAKDVAEKATATAADVRAQATKVAGDLRERGEAAIDATVTRVGTARDAALETIDDEDDPKPA